MWGFSVIPGDAVWRGDAQRHALPDLNRRRWLSPHKPSVPSRSVWSSRPQLGPGPVLAPAVAWLYWQGADGTAIALLLWTLVVVSLDNVIRPLLMTNDADLPMLLMLAGVMGGLLAFGLIGIFAGPVVLAVSYTLLSAWIGDRPQALPEP